MHDVPIYAQLIAERGDVPLQVRNEARQLQRQLDWIINADSSSAGLLPEPPVAPVPGPRQLPPGPNSPDWFA